MEKVKFNNAWIYLIAILLMINFGYTVFRKKPTDKIEAGIEDIKDSITGTGLVVIIIAMVLFNHVNKDK